jgi:hypothetical protein
MVLLRKKSWNTPIGNKIAAAFVKAQKAFGPALKTSTNPHFRSKYADLSNCIEAVIGALNANGIGLMQRTYESKDGVTGRDRLCPRIGRGHGMRPAPRSCQPARPDAMGYGSLH